jgi:hypothetical protein
VSLEVSEDAAALELRFERQVAWCRVVDPEHCRDVIDERTSECAVAGMRQNHSPVEVLQSGSSLSGFSVVELLTGLG